MAECNDDGIFTLYRGKIVYARNDEVRERYLALQQRMNDHLKDQQFCYRKALELDMAMNLYSTLMFEDRLTRARLSGGYIIDCLNKAIGFLNGTVAVVYCEEITSLSDLSQNYNVYRKALYTASNVQEIRIYLESVRMYIKAHRPMQSKPERKVNYQNLADWYQELCLAWRRIY